MADVSHELGSLRFVVESPLSSKVAMFNNQVNKHMESQSLNPFSQSDGRVSPRPTFAPGEYGKPLAGSLTEMRGQKANIHVLKEMLELCQIIDSEGYKVNDEPGMKVIPFGELFNIYTYISDKVVGILLRARKHKIIDFEGECLFQRRDDHVPVFLLKPIKEIRKILEEKQEDIKRSVSPAPQATTVLQDKKNRRHSSSPAARKTGNKPTENSCKLPVKCPAIKGEATEPAPVVTSLPSSPPTTTTATIEVPTSTSSAVTASVPIPISITTSRPTTPTPTIIIEDENNTKIEAEIEGDVPANATRDTEVADIDATVERDNIPPLIAQESQMLVCPLPVAVDKVEMDTKISNNNNNEGSEADPTIDNVAPTISTTTTPEVETSPTTNAA